MKYEISDILNEKNKYGLTLLRIHKKADKGLTPLLILKLSVYDYYFIHILFIIVSSMGILILCNDFIPDYNNYIYLSNWLRYLTPFSLAQKLKMTHFAYIIICSIFFIICIIRLGNTIYLMKRASKYHTTEVYNIKENLLIRILNHIVYVFFSFIIEFLSYIYYIEIFQNDFIIKKDQNLDIFHKIFCVLNAIFIIIYNINNYFFITIANCPSADKSYPFRMRIPSLKLYILIIFQNFSLIHPLQCYLKDNINRIWCIVYVVIFILLLLWIYILTLKSYNYDNILNIILSFIGEFCFVSIIIEIILFLFSINLETTKELIFFIIAKIGITICCFFCIKKIYQKLMMKIINKRIFYNNPYNHPFDNEVINSVWFLRELFEQKNMKYLSKIYGFIIDHQKQCSNVNCACKIIKLKANINKGDKAVFTEDLLKKLNYYIETILINFNFQYNFELSILLSEHFYLYKNNPIMSYSILQTLIHYNYRNLSKKELITIYELMNKYIRCALFEKVRKINIEKDNRDTLNLNKINKEIELIQYFNLIIKIKKAIKFMIYYSKKFITIVKHKDNYENSTIIKMDEIYNEIKYINSPYLTKKVLKDILNFFSEEITYTSDIKKYLNDLEEYNKILPYEFLYKMFLFVDYFWNGKIPDHLINIFFSFTSNRNLYCHEIKQEIYILLENRYIEFFNNIERKYYLLFKYTKGIKISYVSESLSRKLNYDQNDIISNNIDVLLIKDLIEPHDKIVKHFFILQQKNVSKDQHKYIFDKDGYMTNSIINSILEIGINKNILMIVTVEPEEEKNILFYANKNLNIISINKKFHNNLNLSLALIKEFNIEVKELFGIDIYDIDKNYKKEIKNIRNIKEFKILDPKEYIIKNLFKHQNQNNNYHIINKYIINDDNDTSDIDNEERALKEKEKNKKQILRVFHNLFNDISPDLYRYRPITFKINKESFLLNLRKIFDKINSYEQDKLESKNIYNDYLKLTTNFNELSINKNIDFNIKIEPRFVYDTTFYSCKIELYSSTQNILEIDEANKLYELRNVKTETEDLNSTNNNSKIFDKVEKLKIKKLKTNTSISRIEIKEKEGVIYFQKDNIISNSIYYKDKIKKVKASKYKLCGVLLFCIFVLLISCIITLYYQTNLVRKHDKIFDALFYNYYQRTQFIYLNSALLSIFFKIVNISNNNALDDNKDLLLLIGKNIEKSHQSFIKYYMDFKIELNEDFTKLYEPLEANKITVNWENRVFYNDYNSELALIIYRILDSIKHEFNDNDKKDCENLLLGHYLIIERNKTVVYGNFIKLVYYFYKNYDAVLRKYFLSLEQSFEQSLHNFSNQTTSVYIILEVIALISFLLFFVINIFFLINSNKYIFQNILYMFVDFSQTTDYSFKNKNYNLLITKRISNYILLLNEFTPKNLEALKNDKEIENKGLKFMNLKYIMREEGNRNTIDFSENQNVKIKSKMNKKNKKFLDKKISNETFINASLFNFSNSKINLMNSNINGKGLKALNDDIHNLNNKDLINISSNSINLVNNSRNNSSNIVLNSPINSIGMNNSYIYGNQNLISSNNRNRKSEDNIIKSNKIKNKVENKESDIIYNNDLKNENEENKVTIEKVLFQTKITMLNSVKILILIFIIFTLIFIIYYICKLVISLLFISNFHKIISDFKDLTSQYNHMIRYWNLMKTLFILPDTPLVEDFNETEQYFSNINSRVNDVYKNRIKRYKRISNLYDILLSSSLDQNQPEIDFCLNHTRCTDIKNSNSYLLSNGIDSTVNLYAKEISNYYKDFLEVKKSITSKEDIKKYFIDERYSILSSNINHVIIFLEEMAFSLFLQDEDDIVDDFYLKIKILNIVEVCYCALLNLFSVLFVYNFITRIISSVEVASIRINNSIRRMKFNKIESRN